MHSKKDFNDAISKLRAGKSTTAAQASVNEMSLLLKQCIKDSKTAALRSVVRELYINEIKTALSEDDFSLFGDEAPEIQRLFEISSKAQKTSISSRNATACLVTINPPPELDITAFRDYLENLAQKLQSSGYTGVYYFEARSMEPPYGAHVHMVLDFSGIEPPAEFRKTLIQKCTAKKLSIFSKRPSHEQLNVKFSSHPSGYSNFVKYANNPKKFVEDVNISTPLRAELEVDDFIEF